MAQRDTADKGELFIRRATHLNFSFIAATSMLYLGSAALYGFFSLPASPKLVLYMYAFTILITAVSLSASFFIRKRYMPVRTEGRYWSYTAVRRYFWSYVILSAPFGLSFLFYLLVGNFSVLTLGYILSLCGLILFRPKKGDIV
ncbi:MAG TPA: hypothetical protein EYP11_00440 [Aquificaceae bacterium]|nr:hypothetical protein [Aquificaceae bacterium]